jgi:hypothetical protein
MVKRSLAMNFFAMASSQESFMKKLLSVALFALIASPVGLRAQEKTEPLYPLKVGSKWTYKAPGGQVEVRVEKKEKIGDEEAYKLETSIQGKVSASEHVVVRDDGVYRVSVNGLKPDAPIKFLARPATKGVKWDVKTKVQGQEVEGTNTIQEVDVTVPKGTYKQATLVDGPNFKIAGLDTSVRCWFVKDIGIVKLEFKLGGQDAVLELESYEPGK